MDSVGPTPLCGPTPNLPALKTCLFLLLPFSVFALEMELHLSLDSGRVSLPVLERLFPAGADPDQEDENSRSLRDVVTWFIGSQQAYGVETPNGRGT